MELLPEMVKTGGHAVLLSWRIMPDYFHFLLQDKDVVGFVRVLQGRLRPEVRRLNAGGCCSSGASITMRSEKWKHQGDALCIWENPVRTGIIACAHAHPWSGFLAWPLLAGIVGSWYRR
jgi:hypothetical protein